MRKSRLNENLTNLKDMLKAFYPFAQKRIGFNKPVSVNLRTDQANADELLGKTAFYDPEQYSITLYTTGRHPKDIMRSFSHELVHHGQNCRGDLHGTAIGEQGYAQNDEHLREMEREAYEQGNMNFRDWEDGVKSGGEQMSAEISENQNRGVRQMSINEKKLRETVRNAIKNVLGEQDMPMGIGSRASDAFGDMDDAFADLDKPAAKPAAKAAPAAKPAPAPTARPTMATATTTKPAPAPKATTPSLSPKASAAHAAMKQRDPGAKTTTSGGTTRTISTKMDPKKQFLQQKRAQGFSKELAQKAWDKKQGLEETIRNAIDGVLNEWEPIEEDEGEKKKESFLDKITPPKKTTPEERKEMEDDFEPVETAEEETEKKKKEENLDEISPVPVPTTKRDDDEEEELDEWYQGTLYERLVKKWTK